MLRSSSQLFLAQNTARYLSETVKLTEHGIKDNGRDLLHVETRNMCRCEVCFGKHSHQKTGLPFSTGNLHPGVTVTDVGRVSEHYLSLTWSDGHSGLIARTIRGEYGPEPVPTILEKYLDLSMRHNRCQTFWSAKSPDNSTLFDYNTVISSLENTRDFLAHYMVHGVVFLTAIPIDKKIPDVIAALKCGPIRETILGGVDVVRYKPNPKHPVYSSGSLVGHTDLNYYYQVFILNILMNHRPEQNAQFKFNFWIFTPPITLLQSILEYAPSYSYTVVRRKKICCILCLKH